MLNIINFQNKIEWNRIVESFVHCDIYYLHEYIDSFQKDNNAYLIYYKENDFEVCYATLKSDISFFKNFKNTLEANNYFDLETPYGYGGPLVKNLSRDSMQNFFKELKVWQAKENIISDFYRFHPVIKNHSYFENFVEVALVKQTVFIDLSSEEIISKNMNDKCRNMVKKALKNGLSVEVNNSQKAQECFKQLYKQTMLKNNADEYYFFDDLFFEKLFRTLGSLSNLFNVMLDGEIISSALVFEYRNQLHYHLSASDWNFSKLGGNNLLLSEIAKYGCTKGYKTFHLGGGVGSEDGLYIFKKSFNKNGLLNFYIGRTVFDIEKYNNLMEIRKKLDNSFNIDNSRMIGYRT